jgi:hypothetical protein
MTLHSGRNAQRSTIDAEPRILPLVAARPNSLRTVVDALVGRQSAAHAAVRVGLDGGEGHEIDAFIETAPKCFHAVEIKSGETVATDFFKGLDYWRGALKGESITPWVVYGGSASQDRERGRVLPWSDLGPMLSEIIGA